MSAQPPNRHNTPPPSSPSSSQKDQRPPQIQSSSISRGSQSVAIPEKKKKEVIAVAKASSAKNLPVVGKAKSSRVIKRKAPQIGEGALSQRNCVELGHGVLEQEDASAGGTAKKAALSAKVGASEVITQVALCFGQKAAEKAKKAEGSDEIAQHCFELFSRKMRGNEYITSRRIMDLYTLFFETELKVISTKLLNSNNPLNPHPVYIISSLYTCISRLKGSNCRDTRKTHLSKDTRLLKLLEVDPNRRARILQIIKVEGAEKLCRLFKEGPVYTAKELFGTKNVNPVYILHDDQHKPSWVFKPCIRRLNEDEQAVYGVETQSSAYKAYSSGEPQEMSARTEHAAFCLSEENQFPVPCTLLVEINGDRGSVQMYVPGPEVVSVVVDDSSSAGRGSGAALEREDLFDKDLQSMLIFDLLFAHQDRHTDNFLVKSDSSEGKRLYAIDNETCLNPIPLNPLKIEYMDKIAEIKGFREDLQGLYSPEALIQYKTIIQGLGLMQESLNKWLDYVSDKLQRHKPEDETLSDLVKTVAKEYRSGVWK